MKIKSLFLVPAIGLLVLVFALFAGVGVGGGSDDRASASTSGTGDQAPSWNQVVQEQGAGPEQWLTGPGGEPVFCQDERIKLSREDFEQLGLGLHPDYPGYTFECGANGPAIVSAQPVAVSEEGTIVTE